MEFVKVEKEIISIYLVLAHDITSMWDVNDLIVKSFDQHLKSYRLLDHEPDSQKTVLLETARIVRIG